MDQKSAAYSDLERFTELSAALREDATLEQAEKWWTMYQRIEPVVEHHPRTSKYERDLLRRLRARIGEAIRSVREKHPSNPSVSQARIALSALQASMERRVMGLDG